MLSVPILIASVWTAFVITSAKAVPHAYEKLSRSRAVSPQEPSLSAHLCTIASEYRTFVQDAKVAESFERHLTNISSEIAALSHTGNNTGALQRAAIACRISSILFSNATIIEEPQYTAEKEVNW
jgi:hypothetical protein